ncbi:MAG: glutathione S-transferase [Cereibacter sphaeroides]|uniref:Glutathione S-transferase n=1 Tax=Cereibacter sphaeroides TaxID=1063 RepID=A0A2W5SBR6_CERSP|nr:MAG: glutathione S-transferase [Cereibacter sphaeroides]
MLTLYGVYRSRASRPLWLLAEAGMDYTHVPVIQGYRLPDAGAVDAPLNTASPDFLAVNPMGQIPTLTDGDLLLTESMAITLYLAECAGPSLGPKNLAERAQMTNWALFAATSIEAPALSLLQASPEDEAAITDATNRLRRPLARLEAHLTRHDWLLDRFSAADICVGECLRYAQGSKALTAEFPNSFAWLARCQARPGFQAMWQKRSAEPA